MTLYIPKHLTKPSAGSETSPEFNDPDWIAEEKIDGQSGSIVIEGGKVRLSRKTTEVTGVIPTPKLTGVQVPNSFNCFFQVEWAAGKDFINPGETSTFLSSNWRAAYNRTVYILDGWGTYYLDGTEYFASAREPLMERLSWATHFWVNVARNHLKWPEVNVEFSRAVKNGKFAFYQRIICNAGEGVVLKDLTAPFREGRTKSAIKVKAIRELDAWVIKGTPGNGKYTGLVGSLALGLVSEDGDWFEIGKCSGMNDKEREEATIRLQAHRAFAVQVQYLSWTTGCRLTHARFVRFRDDKDELDCDLCDQAPDWVYSKLVF